MLFWDVNNGISRRAWARNPHAISTLERTMEAYPDLRVTVPYLAEEGMVREAVAQKFNALKESVLEYKDPFEPTASDDWEAIR